VTTSFEYVFVGIDFACASPEIEAPLRNMRNTSRGCLQIGSLTIRGKTSVNASN
jgi:hypothetical protein